MGSDRGSRTSTLARSARRWSVGVERQVPTDGERDVSLVIAYPFINDPSILDFAAGRSVVRSFLEAIPSEDTTVLEFPTGHVGTSIAAEAHEAGWPQVREWLSRRIGADENASS